MSDTIKLYQAETDLDDLLAACQDLLDAYWDMLPLEYADSRGLSSMSDKEGERIQQRARDAIARARHQAKIRTM